MNHRRRATLLLLFFFGWSGVLEAEPVRVATVNVANYLMSDRLVEGVYRRSYPKPEIQKAALRAMLRAVDADIIALQEVGDEPFLRELQRDLEREGLPYAHCAWLQGSDAVRHLAVLSRVPFGEVIHHERIEFTYFGERIPVKRGLLEVVFNSENGGWRLFNVHLKSRYTDRTDDPRSEERRVGEAHALRDIIRERLDENAEAAVLVAGDFNDTRASRTLTRFCEINDRPFLEMLPASDSRGETWTHHFKREDVYSRVDYFLASPALFTSIRAQRATVVDDPAFAEASDHRLLWLDLDEKVKGAGSTEDR